MATAKTLKGDKYIYYLMAYELAKLNNGRINVGEDTGHKGGQKFYRGFKIDQYNGQTLLIETKTSPSFADFQRPFVVLDNGSKTPIIREYINEHGENESNRWYH